MRHVDLHVQLDRLTSLAKVLCHSPLGKKILIEAREKKSDFEKKNTRCTTTYLDASTL